MNVLEEALSYRERGWSIIPLERGSKTPVIPWRAYQTQPPTERQVVTWWRVWSKADIGIITGSVSDLAVVDLDGPEGLAQHTRFGETATVQTGRGRHLYFRHGTEPVGNRVGLLPHVDLRGNGGFVVAPPSQHANGTTYAWLNDAPLAPLPNWVRDACNTMQSKDEYKLGAPRHSGRATWGEATAPVLEGGRRNYLWKTGRQARWYGAVPNQIERLLWAENAARCNPPLPEDEVREIIRAVLKTPDKG